MSFRFSGLNREKCCGGAIGMNISNDGEDGLVWYSQDWVCVTLEDLFNKEDYDVFYQF